MNLKRREFIRLGGITVAGSMIIPSVIHTSDGTYDLKFRRQDIDINEIISGSDILKNAAGVEILTEKGKQILI